MTLERNIIRAVFFLISSYLMGRGLIPFPFTVVLSVF